LHVNKAGLQLSPHGIFLDRVVNRQYSDYLTRSALKSHLSPLGPSIAI
jgi:hypothetical protein